MMSGYNNQMGMLPQINQGYQNNFNQGYQVQQSQFQSPPVLYSSQQPTLVSNQNNMNYQMVNLGAGAIIKKMQKRQQEEQLIDMLSRQNEIINELADDFNSKLNERQVNKEEELERLEHYQLILKQKQAEEEYIYKLNRQLNHGLQRIRDQQLRQISYPSQPRMLGMQIPSIIGLDRDNGVFPNPRFFKDKIKSKNQEVQVQLDHQNLYQNTNDTYQSNLEQDFYYPQQQEPQQKQKQPQQISPQSQEDQYLQQQKLSQFYNQTPKDYYQPPTDKFINYGFNKTQKSVMQNQTLSPISHKSIKSYKQPTNFNQSHGSKQPSIKTIRQPTAVNLSHASKPSQYNTQQ